MALVYTALTDYETVISETELAQLAIDSPGGVIDLATIGSGDPGYDTLFESLEAAEADFESYAVKQYQVPIATIPSNVKRKILTLAKYYAFERRNLLREDIVLSYQNVTRWLRDLSAGRVEISIVTPDAQQQHVSFGSASSVSTMSGL